MQWKLLEKEKLKKLQKQLSGKKIADKITSISKSPKELYSKEFRSKESQSKTNENEIEIPKEIYIYISRKKKRNYWWIEIIIII